MCNNPEKNTCTTHSILCLIFVNYTGITNFHRFQPTTPKPYQKFNRVTQKGITNLINSISYVGIRLMIIFNSCISFMSLNPVTH